MNWIILATAFATSSFWRSHACSYFELNTSLDNVKVIGHTMEFGKILGLTNWKLLLVPSKGEMLMNNESNARTSRQFGSIGIGIPPFAVADGMNEKGLTIATQSLYRSEYQKCDIWNKTYKTIWAANLPQWILSQFSTVAEVESAIRSKKFCITSPLPKQTNTHWAIADKQGGSIVLEYEDGEPRIYDNYVGLMTNDPFYPWHVQNLNTYVWILPEEGDNKKLRMDTGELLSNQGEVPFNFGHGFNTGGMPGDPSPPSRFVRMFFNRQISQANSPPKKNLDDWLTLAQGILNGIFITKGFTGPNTLGHLIESDHTSWATLRVPEVGFYAYRSYGNMQWHVVDTRQLDWSQGKVLPTSQSIADGFKNITDELPTVDSASGHFLAVKSVKSHSSPEDVALLQTLSQEL